MMESYREMFTGSFRIDRNCSLRRTTSFFVQSDKFGISSNIILCSGRVAVCVPYSWSSANFYSYSGAATLLLVFYIM